MGTYINKGNFAFQGTRNGEYVDKSELIAVVNKTLQTRQRYSCVSRSRRFGKSMAAEMLCAYYDKSCDSRHLFADLKIASHPSFEQHLNKYPVIYVYMTDFVTRYKDETIVSHMDSQITNDVHEAYPNVPLQKNDKLMDYLLRVCEATGEHFIFIMDEWDDICRKNAPDSEIVDAYTRWLMRMFKSIDGIYAFAGVYITGSTPMMKYKVTSRVNNFDQYTMTNSGKLATYFEFTEDEVKTLAEKHGMDYDELEQWHGGYQIGGAKNIFNPNSVMRAIHAGHVLNDWWGTCSIHKLDHAIASNEYEVRDEIDRLLDGERCYVDLAGLQDYAWKLISKDDILAALVYFGYLTYDRDTKECYVPNREVRNRLSAHVKSFASGTNARLLMAEG